jgi:hypothetical protein
MGRDALLFGAYFQTFGGTYQHRLQGENVSDMMVNFYHNARRNIPENILLSHCLKNV